MEGACIDKSTSVPMTVGDFRLLYSALVAVKEDTRDAARAAFINALSYTGIVISEADANKLYDTHEGNADGAVEAILSKSSE
jgi:hypothetical protein